MPGSWSRRTAAAPPLGPGADLRGADLRAADLAGQDLGGARLDGADLRGARLDGARLAGASLADAWLDGASLAGVDARGADLRRTRAPRLGAERAVLRGARLDGAEWRGARLDGADLADVSARGARFDRGSLREAVAAGARLDRAVFDGADVEGLDLARARADRSAWNGARGRPRTAYTSLLHADLRGASLDGFLGEGSRLGGARLTRSAAARHAEALAAAGRPLGRWERRLGAEPAPAPGDPRARVKQETRAALRDRARRRAIAERAVSARGLERAAALGAVFADRARTWREAVIGSGPEERGWRPEDAGLDFEEESGRRATSWAEARATIDNEARARARELRLRMRRAAIEAARVGARSGDVEVLVAARARRAEAARAMRAAQGARLAVEPLGPEHAAAAEPEPVGPEDAAAAEPEPVGAEYAAAAEPEPVGPEDAAAAEPEAVGPEYAAAAELEAVGAEYAAADEAEIRGPGPGARARRALGEALVALAARVDAGGSTLLGWARGLLGALGRSLPALAAGVTAGASTLLGWARGLLGALGRSLVALAAGVTAGVSTLLGSARWLLGTLGGPASRAAVRAVRRDLARAGELLREAARVSFGADEPADTRPMDEDAGEFRVESIRRDRDRQEAAWLREARARRAARLQREVEARRAAVAAEPQPVPGGVPSDLGRRVLQGVRRLRDAFPAAEELVVGPGADLRGRQLDDRDLSGLDLSGADLEGAGLVGADLRRTDLRGARLKGADLTAARLAGADLRDADLSDAVLDQADLAGAKLDGARVDRAWLGSARGLRAAEREALAARGGDFGQATEAAWARGVGWAMAAAIFLSIGVYLAVRVASEVELDAAALEYQASLAAREGDPARAADRFVALAAQARDPEQRAQYLLEATNASVEAGDLPRALDLLAGAATAAAATPMEGRVQLRTAQVQALAGLEESAVEGFLAALQKSDLGPGQEAEALVGLARLLPPERAAELDAAEADLVARQKTDPQRVALGLALADAWAGIGAIDRAKAAVTRVLDQVTAVEDTVPMRMRLARLLADQGDADGALAIYLDLVRLPEGVGDEARLGAAELYARRGAAEEADAMLAPLRRGRSEDLRARAELAYATIAVQRGEVDDAVTALRRVLDADDVEPRVTDEARILLARILVRDDPAAAAALAEESPELRDELRLGQARALREAGRKAEAREIWVTLAEDPAADVEARVEAGLALAELESEDHDIDGALERLDALMGESAPVPTRQRIQLAASNVLVLGGRLQEAEARYQALLATAQGEVADQCRLGLGRAAELRGQVDRATALYAEVGRSSGPWSVEALASLGRMRERLGDDAGAAAAWRLAADRPGAEPSRRTEIRIHLAQVLARMGDPEAAAVYRELLDAPDPRVRVAARLAVAAEVLPTDPARARALYADAISESEPGEARAEARAGWLRAAVALGEVQAGLDRVRAWLETETDAALRGELAVHAVRALRTEGRLADARAIGERYAEEGGFELGMELAGVLRELGDPAAAAELLSTLTASSGEDEAWRLESLADAHLAAGDLDGAEAALDRLAEAPGQADAAAFGRARLARERGDYREALERLADADDPRAPIERALVLEGLERWEEARVAWERLAAAPDLESRSAGVLGLGRVALALDDPGAALAAVDRLDRVDDGYALTLAQVRGEALRALGRLEEARAVYAELDADAESRVVGALGLGECALAADDPATARARFGDALALTEDPYYRAQALAGLVRAEAEAGDGGAARRTLDRLRREYPDQAEAIAIASEAVP